jgi:hypothetical protein
MANRSTPSIFISGNESFALPAAGGEAVSAAFGVDLSEHDLIKFEPTHSEL